MSPRTRSSLLAPALDEVRMRVGLEMSHRVSAVPNPVGVGRGWLLADGFSFLWVCARSLRSVPSMLHAAGATTAMAVDEDGDSSMQMAAPATGGMDDDLSSLPPLERARRRKSMLLGKP